MEQWQFRSRSSGVTAIRTFGRVYFENGTYQWLVITTDANGYNDDVYLTTIGQVLRGNLGESPFYSNFGLPAKQSIVSQVYPDFYVNFTQQQFAPYFTSLLISRAVINSAKGTPTPMYNVNVVTNYGAKLTVDVAAAIGTQVPF